MIRASKGKRKLACLTAYDYTTARVLDHAGIPLLLVGDSLAMTMLGYSNTLPVTMEQMLHHTAAVARGARDALVVADMPFLSFQISVAEGIRNAGRFIQEAGAHAVKIEGGCQRAELVSRLTENGIPVLGHIGLTPQSVLSMGGFKVQGRNPPEAKALLADALALEKAGAFAIVLECIPPKVAAQVTAEISIPTIGIGAGPDCDGQILVIHDLLGLFDEIQPRFVKRYAELGRQITEAVEAYQRDVTQGAFPTESHTY